MMRARPEYCSDRYNKARAERLQTQRRLQDEEIEARILCAAALRATPHRQTLLACALDDCAAIGGRMEYGQPRPASVGSCRQLAARANNTLLLLLRTAAADLRAAQIVGPHDVSYIIRRAADDHARPADAHNGLLQIAHLHGQPSAAACLQQLARDAMRAE